MRRVGLVAVFASVALLGIAGVSVSYSTYAKWANSPVTFYVNPANADVSANAAVNAVQYAMDVWSTQSGTTFRYQYGGTVNDTATKYDNRNVLLFRNASSGSAIGTTYSWWDSNKNLLDSDIIMWSGNFNFFTGIICGILPNAAYIEDVTTHELGHALGLNHSSNTAATMYPSYGYCSQAFRTLAADDIAGAKALYPAGAPSNTAPVVTITSPANGATFVQGSTISLAGTATDTQDGNISSQIQWTDNGVPVGSGNLLSSILSLVGLHTIRATVTDDAGAQASSQVSVTITLLGSGGGGSTVGTLTATKRYTSTGWERVTLRWTGLSGSTVDVYRNGSKVMNTANDDGVQTDNIGSKGPGTYVYRVCAANTQTCTPDATVVF